MKSIITASLFILLTTFLFAQTPPLNVDLLGSLNPYPGKGFSSLWGYTADDGREYALLGVEDGTSIIDITNPSLPIEVDFIPGPTAFPYHWREMKTHSHYAYIVSEGSGTGTGMQIVDLSYLPDSAVLVNTYAATFTTAHNIYIDNGYAYVVGVSNGGGMHTLDLSDPVNPEWKSYLTSVGYIHDVYVWNDTAYTSSADRFDLVNVSDKSNPVLVSQGAALPGIYAHSGWLSEDKRYFFACEEFDVRELTVWDLQDRSTWNLVVSEWELPGNSPIHNIFIKGNYAHISYYKEGYVVLDISDPTNPVLAGQYDTYAGTTPTYAGAWNCYPFFKSGSVIISDMQTGLYIFNFTLDDPASAGTENNYLSNFVLQQNYPNPFNPSTTIKYSITHNPPSSPLSERGETGGLVSLKVYDVLGKKIATLVNEEKSAGEYEVAFNANSLPSGLYFARLEAGSYSKTIKMILLK